MRQGKGSIAWAGTQGTPGRLGIQRRRAGPLSRGLLRAGLLRLGFPQGRKKPPCKCLRPWPWAQGLSQETACYGSLIFFFFCEAQGRKRISKSLLLSNHCGLPFLFLQGSKQTLHAQRGVSCFSDDRGPALSWATQRTYHRQWLQSHLLQ